MQSDQRARRVVITGASGGLGEALAKHYAEQGAVLGLVARKEAQLRALAEALPCPATNYCCDVRDSAAMRAAGDDFLRRHGCPDIVIANAGVSYGTLTELPEDFETFRKIMDTNVLGMVATFQPFVEAMRAQRHGKLVGIASVAGYRGLPGAEAYCASKAAAITYLESLRVRLKKDGIRVITVSPGYIATRMTRENPYPMPFILSAELAASKIAKAIANGHTYAVIPWQMAIVARCLRLIPRWLFDAALSNVPHKPRRLGRFSKNRLDDSGNSGSSGL